MRSSRFELFRITLVVLCLLRCDQLVAQAPAIDLSSLGSEDRASIQAACSNDKYLNGPAAYHACLLKQLNAVSGSAFPDLASLGSEDRASIQAACSNDKYLNGPAAYHACLRKQLNAVSGSSFPDLSGLGSEDRASIQAACSNDKYLNGPAAYHACLGKQLNAVSGSSFPDLSGLGSEDRSSIQAACSNDKYLNGPAAYHACLNKQLRELGNSTLGNGARTQTYVLARTSPVPAQVPKTIPELKKLSYFTGTWSITGQIKLGSFGLVGNFKGTHRNVWGPDGLSLVSSWTEQRSGDNDSGQATYGYDSDGKTYTYHSVDANGEKEDSIGSVEGQTWTWLSNPTLADGSSVKGRFTMKEESATTYSFRFEIAQTNSDWTEVMEGKASKSP